MVCALFATARCAFFSHGIRKASSPTRRFKARRRAPFSRVIRERTKPCRPFSTSGEWVRRTRTSTSARTRLSRFCAISAACGVWWRGFVWYRGQSETRSTISSRDADTAGSASSMRAGFLRRARTSAFCRELSRHPALDFPLGHYWLGNTYEQLGRYDDAVGAHQIAVAIFRGSEIMKGLGRAYALAGKEHEARQVLDELVQRPAGTQSLPSTRHWVRRRAYSRASRKRTRPPYSKITAIDMNTGERVFEIPVGEASDQLNQHPALQGSTCRA